MLAVGCLLGSLFIAIVKRFGTGLSHNSWVLFIWRSSLTEFMFMFCICLLPAFMIDLALS